MLHFTCVTNVFLYLTEMCLYSVLTSGPELASWSNIEDVQLFSLIALRLFGESVPQFLSLFILKALKSSFALTPKTVIILGTFWEVHL